LPIKSIAHGIPSQAPPASINLETLLPTLDKADQANLPRREQMPDGTITYHYKLKSGQGDLSIVELEELTKNPPDHTKKQLDIRHLLNRLQQLGVNTALSPTHDTRASGTWSPGEKTIRIQPRIIVQGTEEFHEVLAHESVHVAQSCANGGILNQPIALGLSLKYSPTIDDSINSPLYHGDNSAQMQIEREAYSHSQDAGSALSILNYYCR
jgi:hypothetical protein